MSLRSGKEYKQWLKIQENFKQIQIKLQNVTVDKTNFELLSSENEKFGKAFEELLNDTEGLLQTVESFVTILNVQKLDDVKVFLNTSHAFFQTMFTRLRVSSINDLQASLDYELDTKIPDSEQRILTLETEIKALRQPTLVPPVSSAPVSTGSLTTSTITTTPVSTVIAPVVATAPTTVVTSSLVPTPTTTPVLTSNYKRAPIPTFSGGKKENVDRWIFLLECRFKGDRVPENEKVLMAVGYLRDLPLEIYRRVSRQGDPSWTELKATLFKHFQPFDLQMSLRTELLKLRQQGTDYDSYVHSFNLLINQTDNMDESDKISYFRNGLQRKTAEEVQIRRPTTLSGAIDIATAHEQRYHHSSLLPEQSSQPSQNIRFQKSLKEGKPPLRCYGCQQLGHIGPNCPSSRQTKPAKSDKPDKSHPQSLSKPTYSQNTHYQKSSMMIKAKPIRDHLLTVKGTLHGHPCNFVLDTAANVTVVNQNFVQRFHIPTQPTQCTSVQPSILNQDIGK